MLAVSGVCVRRGCTLLLIDLVSSIHQHKGKPQQANPAELLANDPATVKVGASRVEMIWLQVLALQCLCLIARVLPVPCRLGYRVWWQLGHTSQMVQLPMYWWMAST
jgi:hypothetical protein